MLTLHRWTLVRISMPRLAAAREGQSCRSAVRHGCSIHNSRAVLPWCFTTVSQIEQFRLDCLMRESRINVLACNISMPISSPCSFEFCSNIGDAVLHYWPLPRRSSRDADIFFFEIKHLGFFMDEESPCSQAESDLLTRRGVNCDWSDSVTVLIIRHHNQTRPCRPTATMRCVTVSKYRSWRNSLNI